jgi:RES domain-containing protein
MIVFRMCKSKFSNDLTGKGSEISGGRWNSKGVALVYCSESRALCTTEIAVHTSLVIVPNDYQMISIEIPDNIKINEINLLQLSGNWRRFPPTHFTQSLGDNFVKEDKYLVLKVPSAVVQGDFNYLINPKHKEFKRVKILEIKPFYFDSRLFNKL